MISNGDGWRLITFSPPCASMSGGHLRIRLLQPIGARLRADGRRGRPIRAEAAGESPLPLSPSSRSRSRDRANQREVSKKMEMFHRPAGGSATQRARLCCAPKCVKKKLNLEDIYTSLEEFLVLLFVRSFTRRRGSIRSIFGATNNSNSFVKEKNLRTFPPPKTYFLASLNWLKVSCYLKKKASNQLLNNIKK